jgi:uncharacterized secreted protein with C-terminal beta-propeller domain
MSSFRSAFKKYSIQNFFLFFAALISLAGCSRPGNRDGTASVVPLNALKLTPSADCNDLKHYVEEVLIERYTRKAPPVCTDCGDPAPPATAEGDGATTAGGSAALPDDVTRTNTQEEGVDEADLVETDAEGRLYVVNSGFLIRDVSMSSIPAF